MSSSARRRTWWYRGIYACLALVAGTAVWHWTVLDAYEHAAYDWRMAKAAPLERDRRIVVVAIDDESRKQVKLLPAFKDRRRWPWPTSYHQQVLARCFEHGAAVVGVDLLAFDTPSAPSYLHEDEAFAAFCRAHAGRVVLAARYDEVPAEGMVREDWSLPVKDLRAACGVGYVNVVVDDDGVVRRFEPTRKRMTVFDEVGFAVAVLRAYLTAHPVSVASAGASSDGGPRYAVGPWSLPIDERGRALIRFSETPLQPGRGTVVVPYWKLLTGEGYDPQVFEGAIVLLGCTIVDFHDVVSTPLTRSTGRPHWGIAVQADIISSFLDGSPVRRALPSSDGLAAGLAGLAALAVAVFTGALWGPCILMVLVAVYWWVACWSFTACGLVVAVARPVGVMVAVYLAVTAARLAGEERRRREVRAMFSAYVSSDVLTYLETNPEAFCLTGERRDVTVFFSDVQGFTSLSETVTPDVLASILNRYFTPMSDLVMAEGGYVDKYIGDCVMAVFGVPQPLPDHAVRCCRSAVRQLDALARLNEDLRAEFGHALHIRIGLNSGLVSAGNMGSATRFEYTVMGDVVNLGSRLEGANKAYGTRVMVGQATYEAAKDDFHFRLLDLLRVKGKERPVRVYELLGERDAVEPAVLEAMARFEAGWNLYLERRWDEAIATFDEVVDRLGTDGPSALYAERCRAFREVPPPEDWNGVFVMTTK